MRFSERVRVKMFAVTLNTTLLTFGVILVCQGGVHKIAMGEAEIRDVVVERATEPVSFWFSVGFDLFVGAMLAVGAIYGFWLTFRRQQRTSGRDDAR